MPRIGLAVSRLGGVPGVGSAYHSSILIDGTEFFFSDEGVMRVPPRGPGCEEVASHVGVGSCTEVFEMGASTRLGRQLVQALGPFFLPGTYDFVRKNCNSFSDCALFFLLGRRLDPKYRELDLIGGRMHSKVPAFLAAASMGTYSANDAADGFDVEATIEKLATARARSASPKRGRASRSSPAKQLRAWSKESEAHVRSYSKPCETILEEAGVQPGTSGDDLATAGSASSTAPAPPPARSAPAQEYRLRLAEDDDDDDDGYNDARSYSMRSIQEFQEAASEVLLPQAKLVKRYVRRHSESAAQAIQKAMKGVRVCCVPTVAGAEPEDCAEEEDMQAMADAFAGYRSEAQESEPGCRYLSEHGCDQRVEAQVSERTRATYGAHASISFEGL